MSKQPAWLLKLLVLCSLAVSVLLPATAIFCRWHPSTCSSVGAHKTIGVFWAQPATAKLLPLEWHSRHTAHAQANPVTPTAAAQPALIHHDLQTYLFYQQPSEQCIAVAASLKQTAWTQLGTALCEPAGISHASIVIHEQLPHLLAIVQSRLQLYTATRFPLSWKLTAADLPAAASRSASLWEDGGQFWLLASPAKGLQAGAQLHSASHLRGPWRPVQDLGGRDPLQALIGNLTRPAYKGLLVRSSLHRDWALGRKVVPPHLLSAKQLGLHQPQGSLKPAWDAGGWAEAHGICPPAAPCVLAAAGSRVEPWSSFWAASCGLLTLLAACLLAQALQGSAASSSLSRLLAARGVHGSKQASPWQAASDNSSRHEQDAGSDAVTYSLARPQRTFPAVQPGAWFRLQWGWRARMWGAVVAARKLALKLPAWTGHPRVAKAAAAGACLAAAASWALRPGPPALPLAVGGSYAQFTLVTLSFEGRAAGLPRWVAHYGRCPSVAEIVVVWNRGPPPKNLQAASPVRVRVEAGNRLTNRFKPDGNISTPGILSLDDDIYISCQDVERGFAAWRAAPDSLVGYHSRLLEGKPLQYRGEKHAFRHGRYNLILAGAAFMPQSFLGTFSAAPLQGLRDMVDQQMNGEDLLLNFAVAAACQLPQPCLQIYLRPSLGPVRAHKPAGPHCLSEFQTLLVPVRSRIHAWMLSGVGISSDQAEHYRRRTKAVAELRAHFGDVLRPALYDDVPELKQWQSTWAPLQWFLRKIGSVNFPPARSV